MSLESAGKLGATASLINILLPIVAVVGVVAIILFSVLEAANGIASGNITPFLGISLGFWAFIIVICVVAFAGFIMFLVAMYRLSHYYNEPSIFNKVLYAFIISIFSTTVTIVMEFAFLFSSFARISPLNPTPTTAPEFSFFFLIIVLLVAISLGLLNG
jgi:uncharacterized membrane protein